MCGDGGATGFFPRALLRVVLTVFSFQRRVGLWGSASQPLTTYSAITAGSGFLVYHSSLLFIQPCDCLMSRWPRLRLSKCVDDFTIEPHGRDSDHGGSEVNDGLDFHVSKDEEGMEGKSVVLVSNGALKTALASSMKALGMRVVSHARILGIDVYGVGTARQLKTQYGRLAKIKKGMPIVKFHRKYGAITSKIAKEGLMPSGLHGMRCTPPRVTASRTTMAVSARQACRAVAHVAARGARVRLDSHVQNRANRSVGRGSVGRAAG